MNKKNETLSNFIIKHLANLSSITKAWKVALPPIEKIAYKKFVDNGDPARSGSRRLRKDQFYIAANLVRGAFKAYDKGSPAVKEKNDKLIFKRVSVKIKYSCSESKKI